VPGDQAYARIQGKKAQARNLFKVWC
jgi:hypothetical protein